MYMLTLRERIVIMWKHHKWIDKVIVISLCSAGNAPGSALACDFVGWETPPHHNCIDQPILLVWVVHPSSPPSIPFNHDVCLKAVWKPLLIQGLFRFYTLYIIPVSYEWLLSRSRRRLRYLSSQPVARDFMGLYLTIFFLLEAFECHNFDSWYKPCFVYRASFMNLWFIKWPLCKPYQRIHCKLPD